MKSDNEIYYVFKCGCEYSVNDCKKKFIGIDNKSRSYVCPKHGDVPILKYMYCSECGERVDSISLKGIAKKMHTECAKKKASRRKKEMSKREYNVYLEYPCRCVLTREQSTYGYIKGSGKHSKKAWCCPEHNKQAVKRFIYCKKCKKKIYISLQGKAKIMCDHCVKKEKLGRQRRYLKKQRKNGIKQIKKLTIKHENLFNCEHFGGYCNQCILVGTKFKCNMFKRVA